MIFTGYDDRQPRSTCSFIGTTAAILAATLATAGASVASGVIGSKAAKNSAKVQTEAANRAADLQNEQFKATQANLKPWLDAGRGGLEQLNQMLGPGGKLTQGYAPFDEKSVQSEFDPGFAYRMKQSNDALQSWAASKGGLLSGGTGQKLIRNSQEMGGQEYQNANSRALQKYQVGRDTFFQNQNDLYTRLSGLAGIGERAAAGENAAGDRRAALVGQEGENAAATTAAGGVGAANSWTTALGGFANALSNYGIMNNVLGGDNSTSSTPSWMRRFAPQPVGPDGFTPGYSLHPLGAR